jgi:hypothetical protein
MTKEIGRRRKPKIGDVFALNVANGLGYLHFIGKHPEYGTAVKVAIGIHEQPPQDLNAIFIKGYVTFYPVGPAVSQGLVQIVGHIPSPTMPTRYRRIGALVGRRITTWIIEDASGEVVRQSLSAEELILPIAAIWNHDFLVQRIAEEWTPAQEGAS